MGGIIRTFVDTATGPGGVSVQGTSTEFDDIIGAHAPVGRTGTVTPIRAAQTGAEPRVAPTPIREGRSIRRRRRGPALLTVGALTVAGLALSGASIISADAIVRGPLTDSQAVLAAEKGHAAAVADVAGTPFGSTSALGDQLTVAVSDPVAYSPAAGATGTSPGVDVVSTVTVTNVSGGPVDPRLSFVVQGATATRIFDKKQGIRLNTVASLDSGESITYRIAWAADALPKFALKVTSADSGKSVVYGP